MQSFWVVCLLAGITWLPMLPLLLRVIKIAMLEKGLGRVRALEGSSAAEGQPGKGGTKGKGHKSKGRANSRQNASDV